MTDFGGGWGGGPSLGGYQNRLALPAPPGAIPNPSSTSQLTHAPNPPPFNHMPGPSPPQTPASGLGASKHLASLRRLSNTVLFGSELGFGAARHHSGPGGEGLVATPQAHPGGLSSSRRLSATSEPELPYFQPLSQTKQLTDSTQGDPTHHSPPAQSLEDRILLEVHSYAKRVQQLLATELPQEGLGQSTIGTDPVPAELSSGTLGGGVTPTKRKSHDRGSTAIHSPALALLSKEVTQADLAREQIFGEQLTELLVPSHEDSNGAGGAGAESIRGRGENHERTDYSTPAERGPDGTYRYPSWRCTYEQRISDPSAPLRFALAQDRSVCGIPIIALVQVLNHRQREQYIMALGGLGAASRAVHHVSSPSAGGGSTTPQSSALGSIGLSTATLLSRTGGETGVSSRGLGLQRKTSLRRKGSTSAAMPQLTPHLRANMEQTLEDTLILLEREGKGTALTFWSEALEFLLVKGLAGAFSEADYFSVFRLDTLDRIRAKVLARTASDSGSAAFNSHGTDVDGKDLGHGDAQELRKSGCRLEEIALEDDYQHMHPLLSPLLLFQAYAKIHGGAWLRPVVLPLCNLLAQESCVLYRDEPKSNPQRGAEKPSPAEKPASGRSDVLPPRRPRADGSSGSIFARGADVPPTSGDSEPTKPTAASASRFGSIRAVVTATRSKLNSTIKSLDSEKLQHSAEQQSPSAKGTPTPSPATSAATIREMERENQVAQNIAKAMKLFFGSLHSNGAPPSGVSALVTRFWSIVSGRLLATCVSLPSDGPAATAGTKGPSTTSGAGGGRGLGFSDEAFVLHVLSEIIRRSTVSESPTSGAAGTSSSSPRPPPAPKKPSPSQSTSSASNSPIHSFKGDGPSAGLEKTVEEFLSIPNPLIASIAQLHLSRLLLFRWWIIPVLDQAEGLGLLPSAPSAHLRKNFAAFTKYLENIALCNRDPLTGVHFPAPRTCSIRDLFVGGPSPKDLQQQLLQKDETNPAFGAKEMSVSVPASLGTSSTQHESGHGSGGGGGPPLNSPRSRKGETTSRKARDTHSTRDKLLPALPATIDFLDSVLGLQDTTSKRVGGGTVLRLSNYSAPTVLNYCVSFSARASYDFLSRRVLEEHLAPLSVIESVSQSLLKLIQTEAALFLDYVTKAANHPIFLKYVYPKLMRESMHRHVFNFIHRETEREENGDEGVGGLSRVGSNGPPLGRVRSDMSKRSEPGSFSKPKSSDDLAASTGWRQTSTAFMAREASTRAFAAVEAQIAVASGMMGSDPTSASDNPQGLYLANLERSLSGAQLLPRQFTAESVGASENYGDDDQGPLVGDPTTDALTQFMLSMEQVLVGAVRELLEQRQAASKLAQAIVSKVAAVLAECSPYCENRWRHQVVSMKHKIKVLQKADLLALGTGERSEKLRLKRREDLLQSVTTGRKKARQRQHRTSLLSSASGEGAEQKPRSRRNTLSSDVDGELAEEEGAIGASSESEELSLASYSTQSGAVKKSGAAARTPSQSHRQSQLNSILMRSNK